MKALMHQNLGILEYNLATQMNEELKRSSSNPGNLPMVPDVSYGTFEATALRAREHLSTSAAIFDRYFHSSADSSTNREHVHTKQILAAVRLYYFILL